MAPRGIRPGGLARGQMEEQTNALVAAPAVCLLLLPHLVAWSPVSTTGGSTPTASFASIAVVRNNLITAATTQDFTVAGFGTPTAALLLLNGGVTDGTVSVNEWSIGCVDGADHWVVAGPVNSA